MKDIKLTNEIKKKLDLLYSKPSQAGSFSSKYKLKRAIRDLNIDIKNRTIDKWLSGNEAYTKHRNTRERFKRSKVITQGIRYLFDADLMDVSNVSKENFFYKLLLFIHARIVDSRCGHRVTLLGDLDN